MNIGDGVLGEILRKPSTSWSEQECLLLIKGVRGGVHSTPFVSGLRRYASSLAEQHFHRKVYLRGLIEISNICKNDCYYCGIRRENTTIERYRLTEGEILDCCDQGWKIGFRTLVLQGGEDPYWQGDKLVALVEKIHQRYPDCALTLSMGELSHKLYQRLYDAGANRYLLRHETMGPEHYQRLHPSTMRLEQRVQCLMSLREIGYQVGTGVMIGSPYQTAESLAKDLHFIAHFQPEMIGIGPFIPHPHTPFRDFTSGTLQQTLHFIMLCRIAVQGANIPATTALATLHPSGRTEALLSGANVVMPNLTPLRYREAYDLYEGKACHGAEAAEGIKLLEAELQRVDLEISWDRGDYAKTIETTQGGK